MKENKLLEHWTGSGEIVMEKIEKHAEWKRRADLSWWKEFYLWMFMISFALATLMVGGQFVVAHYILADVTLSAVVATFLYISYKPLSREEPSLGYPMMYGGDRDRLAKVLGIDPERLESMDYDRLRNGIILPTLDGLFVKLRAQATGRLEEDAKLTYAELEALHSVCPPFRFFDGTEDRYILEPFESYVRPSVPA